MPSSKDVVGQIHKLTEMLIGLSLCNQQNYPSISSSKGRLEEIGIENHLSMSIALKNIPYNEIYAELCRTKAYNLMMLDGALLQMMYRFNNNNIESHRLAFFPSPSLEKFQNNPDIYLKDEIYADINARNIVPFPLRFDFNAQFIDAQHPKSHLTLGQYANCRIPVSSPLSPYHFIGFILMNFYNTAFHKYSEKILRTKHSVFTETITGEERKLMYLQIP
ncbi:hypothetical protein AGMMS50229_03280 [Campylobacterota bacterium]|nr:hypothetical protein AGMMS50229_03280 [Campylobacterota bacterium]